MRQKILKEDSAIEMIEVNRFDYTELFKRYIQNWYYFAGFIGISILFAFVYNQFSPQVYQISSTILIENESQEFSGSASGVFQGINPFASNTNFYNEITVINSYPIIYKAIQNLNYNVSYYGFERAMYQELYHSSPFIVSYPQNFPEPVNLKFKIKFIGNNQFIIRAKGKDVVLYNYSENKVTTQVRRIKFKKTAFFGEEIIDDYFRFKLILNNKTDDTEYQNSKFAFVFHDLSLLADEYKSQLVLNIISPESTVATLDLNSSNVEKAIDFLNSLTNEYLRENLAKKNHYAKATIDYINGQMQKIADSLSFTEEKLQNFRSNNQVLNIADKADRIYTQVQTLETEKASLIIKQKYYVYIKDYFEQNTEITDLIAPSALGIEDPLLTNLIQNLIQLNTEKNGLIENNQQKSPYLRKLDISIDNLKNTISENINYLLNTVEISIQDVNQRISLLNSELNKLPETERKLMGIERKFNINDAIYTYLLQRNAEAQITMASNLPNTELVEPPRVIGQAPIKPKKKLNYLLGFIVGLFIPGAYFFVKEAVKDSITTKEEIQRITRMPVIGQIMHKRKTYRNKVVFLNPGSAITESFRILRSNLQFFVKDSPHHVILVTSTISGEGKSFCAFNLASILATNSKKTILLAFDMRKPDFYEELGFKNLTGISSILSCQTPVEDAVQNTENSFLQVITPGPIPPNPAELITSPESKQLLERLKQSYNYIIIDTPPVGIVSDCISLMPYADTKIYVIRLNFTPKKAMIHSLGDFELREHDNACILINDYRVTDKQYGYSYRYYYSDKKGEKAELIASK